MLNAFFRRRRIRRCQLPGSAGLNRWPRNTSWAGPPSKVKNHLSLYLSSCQLGNTLAALALGAVTAPAVGSLVEPLTALSWHLGSEAKKLVAFLLSFSIAVALHIVIGERGSAEEPIHSLPRRPNSPCRLPRC